MVQPNDSYRPMNRFHCWLALAVFTLVIDAGLHDTPAHMARDLLWLTLVLAFGDFVYGLVCDLYARIAKSDTSS
jgi:hypothetical protein